MGFSYSERNIRYHICASIFFLSYVNLFPALAVSPFSPQLKLSVSLVKRHKRQYLCQPFGLFALYSN